MRLPVRTLLTVLVAGSLHACYLSQSDDPGSGCSPDAKAGFMLTVVDSVSGSPINDATGVAVGMDVTEPLERDRTQANVLYGSIGRMGTFDVTVGAPGYLDWRATVEVPTENGCSPVLVSLRVPLVWAGAPQRVTR